LFSHPILGRQSLPRSKLQDLWSTFLLEVQYSAIVKNVSVNTTCPVCLYQVDDVQMEKILELIESGKSQGAKLMCGGGRIEDVLETRDTSLSQQSLLMSTPVCALPGRRLDMCYVVFMVFSG